MEKLDFSHKSAHGVYWENIFHHNLAAGMFDKSECLNNSTPNKFSALKYITPLLSYNGFYEFLLEYEDLNGYVRWRQNVSPIERKEVTIEDDIGLDIIHNDFEYFRGLLLSTADKYSYNQYGVVVR